MTKVELIGKFYDNHSLSIVNRELAIALSKYSDNGFEVFITPMDGYAPEAQVPKSKIKILKELESKDIGEPDVQIRHTYPPMWRFPVDKKTLVIFIQPWEFQKVPFEWQYKWEQFADGLITFSSWTGNVYLESGLNPEDIYIIPGGYDPAVFNTEKTGDSKILGTKNPSKMVYTFVGNGQYRKGIDLLMNAWVKLFVKADNALLVIKDSPAIYGTNNILEECLKSQYKMGCAEIIYNDDNVSEQEMANLYKNSDILIHPFRGEGFGLHIQEAMACGCVPIISKGGGPSDFVNDENGILIETTRQFINYMDDKVFATRPGDSLTLMNQHGWIMEPIEHDMIMKMKNLYNYINFEELRQKALKSKLTTWAEAAGSLKGVIHTVQERRKIPKRFR